MCTKHGFSVLRIINIIILSLAIVTHIAGIAYPVWSHFQFVSFGTVVVESSQGLWSIDILTDKVHAFVNKEEDTGWKVSVVALEMTSVSVAAIGLLTVVLQASVIRIRDNKIISALLRVSSVVFLTTAGISGISGLLLYWTQKQKVFSDLAKDPKSKIPLDTEESGTGMYCTMVGSAIYIITVILEFIVLLTETSKSTESHTNSSTRKETKQKFRQIAPMQRPERNDAFDF